MAVANLGRPLGASLAVVTSGAGDPALMYWSLGSCWAGIVVLLLLVRIPGENRAFHDTAEVLPQGEGLAPQRD